MKKNHEELMFRWFSGELKPEEIKELEQILLHTPGWRVRFRKEANLDVLLRDDALDASLKAWQSEGGGLGISVNSLSEKAKTAKTTLWWGLTALSCLAVGWGLHFIRSEPSHLPALSKTAGLVFDTLLLNENDPNEAAILTKTVNASWTDSHTDLRPGDILQPGVFNLKEGYAFIEFYDGATLLLEGPAQLELVNSAKSILHRGRARVHVPNPAHDFVLQTPNHEVTTKQGEFGVNFVPEDQVEEFYVFQNSAQILENQVEKANLNAGQVYFAKEKSVLAFDTQDDSRFVSMDSFEMNRVEHANLRFGEWQNWLTQAKKDHRLLAFFPFGRNGVGERELSNTALSGPTHCNGGIVGARWTQGRWPDKHALEFRRPGDRVRLELAGQFDFVTIACWVKVDSLDRKYNGILLTDGFEPGELHWQLSRDGRLLLSIADHQVNPDNTPVSETFSSPVVFSKSHFGRWHHLAVSYDRTSGEVIHFVDGKQVSHGIPSAAFSRPAIVFGPCELGNWGKPLKGVREPVRNLNGCLDEFSIYKTVLSQSEISQLFEAGKME